MTGKGIFEGGAVKEMSEPQQPKPYFLKTECWDCGVSGHRHYSESVARDCIEKIRRISSKRSQTKIKAEESAKRALSALAAGEKPNAVARSERTSTSRLFFVVTSYLRMMDGYSDRRFTKRMEREKGRGKEWRACVQEYLEITGVDAG